jgi:hypothetical protein
MTRLLAPRQDLLPRRGFFRSLPSTPRSGKVGELFVSFFLYISFLLFSRLLVSAIDKACNSRFREGRREVRDRLVGFSGYSRRGLPRVVVVRR